MYFTLPRNGLTANPESLMRTIDDCSQEFPESVESPDKLGPPKSPTTDEQCSR